MADDVVPSGVRDLITADERHLGDQIVDCVSWLESGKAHARDYATRLLAALQQARQQQDQMSLRLAHIEADLRRAVIPDTLERMITQVIADRTELAKQRDVEQAQLAAQDAALQALQEMAEREGDDLSRRSHDLGDEGGYKQGKADAYLELAANVASVRAARREGER